LATLPAHDEVEVSVFGPGVGEAAAVHLGNGRWLLVDSCRDSRTQSVATLSYLKSLDLDPATCVDWVVATHAHDDHIDGFAETVRACGQAEVVVSGASTAEEFFAISRIGERFDFYDTRWRIYSEMREVFSAIESRRRTGTLHFAEAGMVLPMSTRSDPEQPSLVFLAPSGAARLQSAKVFGRLFQAAVSAEAGARPVPSRDPNQFSIALSIRCLGHLLLFGGDVKNGSANWGWRHAMTILHDEDRYEFFKVSHHGDDKAHLDELWADQLIDDCVCVVTPFRSSHRPRDTDLARMRITGRAVYLTAKSGDIPKATTVRRTAADLGPLARGVREVGGMMGHVRFRHRQGQAATVETIGPAYRVA
jgi:beta-lactamase superfamily II metal-dependent hydrolase